MTRSEILSHLSEKELMQLVFLLEHGYFDFWLGHDLGEIVHYYLMNKPLQILADRHGLSRERIRQLGQKHALRCLRVFARCQPQLEDLLTKDVKDPEVQKQIDHVCREIIAPFGDVTFTIKKSELEDLFGSEYNSRLENLLRENDIDTIEKLTQYSRKDILRFRNMGYKTLAILESALAKRGLKLAASGRKHAREQIQDKALLDMNFSSRVLNAFLRNEIKTLDELLEMCERDITGLNNLGEESKKEILHKLAINGLKLKSREESTWAKKRGAAFRAMLGISDEDIQAFKRAIRKGRRR